MLFKGRNLIFVELSPTSMANLELCNHFKKQTNTDICIKQRDNITLVQDTLSIMEKFCDPLYKKKISK